MRSRSFAALAASALLPLATACSSDDAGSSAPDAAAQKSAAANVAWSPCDGVDAAEVSQLAGQPMTEETGSADQPRCTFLPVAEGGPAYDVSYLFFDGGLDAALGSMGAAGRQLRPAEVAGAVAARVAVKATSSGILVTGFVETEGLVQSVNAAQVAPYDEEQVTRSTTDLLAALAREAPDPSAAGS